MIPSLIRPLVYRFVSEVGRVAHHNVRARDLLTPILKSREHDEKTVLGYQKPNDTIEWIRELLPEEDKKDYAYQGIAQLAITAVSVHSIKGLTANIMLNLMTYPKYIPILREEVETVLAESGGELSLESMSKLVKLDSFMKESLRFKPPLTGISSPSFIIVQ